MKTVFEKGGPLFENASLFSLSILTLILIILVAWAFYYGLPLLNKQQEISKKAKPMLGHLKSIGLFALIVGVLDQLIGLYSIFANIEEAGDINMSIVLSAFKTSMLPFIYGLSIYLFALLIWFLFDLHLKSKIID
jgi:hypothetical protein